MWTGPHQFFFALLEPFLQACLSKSLGSRIDIHHSDLVE
jgi:hypothetical protein